jgi:sec-independent protein translocase protein TatA
MFELGPEKLIVLLLICLVVFGGKRLPEVGGAIGKGIREFKRGMSDLGDSINTPSADLERPTPSQRHAPIAEQSEPKRLLER